jgi:sugar-specific transcriptional regulator TrmB
MRQKLLKLGLSWNAVKAYESLLKLGETTVGDIIKDVRAHRQSVYNALEELEEKGMIDKTVKNKIGHYKVSNPQAIVENAQSQLSLAESLSREIQATFLKSKHDHEINVYEGREKIRRFFMGRNKNMPTGSSLYVISNYADRYTQVLGMKYLKEELDPMQKRKKMKIRIIAKKSSKKEFGEFLNQLKEKLDRQVKFISDDLMPPVAVEIWNSGISFSYFEENDWFVVEFKNDRFQKVYTKYFQNLWETSKD